ncbi:MAG: alpha/beta hydrolase [Bacteroidetes bacterium]|nr:alpha/beta hydrolase [Bacteroidota bacterium]
MKFSKRKIFKTVWFTIVAVFLIWNWATFQSRNLPDNTFESNDKIAVTESSDKITFSATNTGKTTEVIFFQGGLTDPKAYAPLCRKIAENGFTCHLIKMSWRLPQYDYQKVSRLFDLNSGRYVIGGHSQGGKMASQFVYENQKLLKGLFLLGTSHPRDIDLSNLTVPTLKLYAEKDGLASVQEVMENKRQLPQNSRLILIAGGNHSQFGYLGRLFLDDKPDISREEQQQETLKQLIAFLTEVDDEGQ